MGNIQKFSTAVASAWVTGTTWGVKNSSLLAMYWAQQAVPRNPAIYFRSLFSRMSTIRSTVSLIHGQRCCRFSRVYRLTSLIRLLGIEFLQTHWRISLSREKVFVGLD